MVTSPQLLEVGLNQEAIGPGIVAKHGGNTENNVFALFFLSAQHCDREKTEN